MNLQNAHNEMVEWMRAFGQEVPQDKTIPSQSIINLRSKLIDEESMETTTELNRLHFSVKYNDPKNCRESYVSILDGLGDLLFVTIGTLVSFGVDTQQVWNEILRSNWTKFWTPSEIRGLDVDNDLNYAKWVITSVCRCSNDNTRCFLVNNSIGKVVKSPSFSPPNLYKFLPKELDQQAKERNDK